jgi:hypothetical protein
VAESNINCSCEIWAADYKLKKKVLSKERDFWKGAAETSTILKIKVEELEKNGGDTNNLGKMGRSSLNVTTIYCV